LAAGLLGVGVVPARAATIFSNVVGNCCGGYQVAGASEGSEAEAEAFVPGSAAVLGSVSVEVDPEVGFGGDPYFDVLLYSNASGLPGSLIATLGTDLTAPSGGALVPASGASVALSAGTEYWVVLTPYDSLSQLIWEAGGTVAPVNAFTTSTSGTSGWVTDGTAALQFAVNSPVPEPESLVLVVSGVLGVVGMMRRRVVVSRLKPQ
jgi:hypothetical protein